MLRRLTFLTVFPLVSFAGSDEIFTGEGTSYTLGQVSSGNCNFMYDPGVGENYAALNNEQWNRLTIVVAVLKFLAMTSM
ncbi:hypothetical protein Plhal304r1_c054g0139721 [Plasmopara halstedii]